MASTIPAPGGTGPPAKDDKRSPPAVHDTAALARQDAPRHAPQRLAPGLPRRYAPAIQHTERVPGGSTSTGTCEVDSPTPRQRNPRRFTWRQRWPGSEPRHEPRRQAPGRARDALRRSSTPYVTRVTPTARGRAVRARWPTQVPKYVEGPDPSRATGHGRVAPAPDAGAPGAVAEVGSARGGAGFGPPGRHRARPPRPGTVARATAWEGGVRRSAEGDTGGPAPADRTSGHGPAAGPPGLSPTDTQLSEQTCASYQCINIQYILQYITVHLRRFGYLPIQPACIGMYWMLIHPIHPSIHLRRFANGYMQIHAHTYVSYLDTCKYLLIPANTLGFFQQEGHFWFTKTVKIPLQFQHTLMHPVQCTWKGN